MTNIVTLGRIRLIQKRRSNTTKYLELNHPQIIWNSAPENNCEQNTYIILLLAASPRRTWGGRRNFGFDEMFAAPHRPSAVGVLGPTRSNNRRLNPTVLESRFESRFSRNWDTYLHKMNHAYRDMSPVNITLDLWTLFVYLVHQSQIVCAHVTHIPRQPC